MIRGKPKLDDEVGGSVGAAGGEDAADAAGQGEDRIKAPADAGPDGEPISGRVKWFDVVKGYGFVTPVDGGGDILVHYNLLAPLGRKSLPEGATISVVSRQSARGRRRLQSWTWT